MPYIQKRALFAGADQRMAIGGTEVGGVMMRPLEIGTTWTKMRVAFTCQFGISTTLPATAGQVRFGFGLVSGTSGNTFSEGPPWAHSVFLHYQRLWQSVTSYYLWATNIYAVNTYDNTKTTNTFSSAPTMRMTSLSSSGAARTVVVIEFQKGSPWTIEVLEYPSATPSDRPITTTLAGMESSTMTGMASTIGYVTTVRTSTLTIDEATNGYLDQIAFFTSKQTPVFEVNHVVAARIA